MTQAKTEIEINTGELLLSRAITGKAKLVGTLNGVNFWSDVDMEEGIVYALPNKMKLVIDASKK